MYVRMYVYICTYVCMGVAKNPVWLGIDMLIYHWTSLAKNLNGAKRFNDYTVYVRGVSIQSSSSVAIQVHKGHAALCAGCVRSSTSHPHPTGCQGLLPSPHNAQTPFDETKGSHCRGRTDGCCLPGPLCWMSCHIRGADKQTSQPAAE